MKIYGEKNKKLVIALGFFDCVHVGHALLVEKAKSVAEKLHASCGVFTFCDNPYLPFFGDRKLILTFEERKNLFFSLGAETVVATETDKGFFDKSAKEFLEELCDCVQIAGFVCGEDYTFGKNREGTVQTLKDFARDRNILVEVVAERKFENEKISSKRIADELQSGNIDKVNLMLGRFYSVCGEVMHGRGDGKKSGLPTVNLAFESGKIYPKFGVYSTFACVDGEFYSAVTNVGTHPTYGDDSANMETFLIGFDGDLYGKTVKISFLSFLREIKRFSSVDELNGQIKKDIEASQTLFKEIEND